MFASVCAAYRLYLCEERVYLYSCVSIFYMDLVYDLTLYSPFFASLFWVIALLCSRKNNCRQQNIWLVWLAVQCVESLIWTLYFGGIDDYTMYYKLDVADITLFLASFPLIYFYFRSLTHRGRFTWREYVWLAPSLFVCVASSVLYYLMGSDRAADCIRMLIENIAEARYVPWSLEWMLRMVSAEILTVVFVVQVVIVMIYSLRNYVKYKKGLANFFSNLDEKSIAENRAVLTGLFVILGCSLIVAAMWELFPAYYYFMRYFLMAFFACVLYYMSYHVSRIGPGTEDFADLPGEPDAKHMSVATLNEACAKLLPALVRLVDGERIFLQPNLSLGDIALRLGTNRTYISHIINTEFECSFYDFINGKRISFAQELITCNPGLSHEQVAEMAGFVSASTFSRVFKKQTGKTFSQWRRGAHMRV